VVSIAPAKGLAILRRLLEEDTAQVMVSKVDWKKWAVSFPAEYAANAELLSGLMPAGSGDVGAGKVGSGWMAQWLETPMGQRKQKLAARVEERLRAALSMGSRQTIDRTRPLQEYGLDSLLAIELRNALSADLEMKLSSTALFDYPTMGGLTDWLFDDVLKAGDAEDSTDEAAMRLPDAITRDVVSGVSELSDEEVERLFQEKMART
jgi:acyl carrier protein